MDKEKIELRNVVIEEIDKQMSLDKNIVFLDADLMGSSGSNKLQQKYRDRVINCGIMEAQEISMAAGMSKIGFKPYVHTFTAFATRRVLDQIFVSSLYQNAPITIIASDAGIQAVHNGGTHMSFEDMGLLRGLPDTVIVEPTDSYVLRYILNNIPNKLTYIRLTRKQVYKIYDEKEKFEIGKAKVIKEGKDITIIAMGLMVKEALEASRILELKGISCNVIDMFTLKPLDKESIIKYCKDKKLIVTAENHSIINGLSTAVSEVLSEEGNCPKQIKIGVKERFGQVGTLEFLQEEYGLTSKEIVKKVLENLK